MEASLDELELRREELEPLVLEGLTVSTISATLDRPPTTVRQAIARYGLPQPIEVRRCLVREALDAGRRTLIRECRKHGRTEFAIVGSRHRLHCKRCRAEAVARRRRKVKELLVAEAGGQCAICHYSRCVQALEFHHLDPSEKTFGLAQRGVTRAIAEVRAEAAKCVLLCANCHAEVEAGVASLSRLPARSSLVHAG